MTLTLSPNEQVLLLAPHPDDEGLAAGGLLQRLWSVGGNARIVYATNGENNAWAQRACEHRWRIDADDRQRWARLRQTEARAALQVLGAGSRATTRFLNLPDQGMTELLRTQPDSVVRLLEEEILHFRPSIFILPSTHDAHPDHSALFVLASLALQRVRQPKLRVLSYVIHQPAFRYDDRKRTLCLTEAEQEHKLRAIYCYRSQLRVFPKRFLRFAQPTEEFYEVNQDLRASPVTISSSPGTLSLSLPRQIVHRRSSGISLALQSEAGETIFWRVEIRMKQGKALVRNGSNGLFLAEAEIRPSTHRWELRLPLKMISPIERGFLKIAAPAIFFEKQGWFEFEVREWNRSCAVPLAGTRAHY